MQFFNASEGHTRGICQVNRHNVHCTTAADHLARRQIGKTAGGGEGKLVWASRGRGVDRRCSAGTSGHNSDHVRARASDRDRGRCRTTAIDADEVGSAGFNGNAFHPSGVAHIERREVGSRGTDPSASVVSAELGDVSGTEHIGSRQRNADASNGAARGRSVAHAIGRSNRTVGDSKSLSGEAVVDHDCLHASCLHHIQSLSIGAFEVANDNVLNARYRRDQRVADAARFNQHIKRVSARATNDLITRCEGRSTGGCRDDTADGVVSSRAGNVIYTSSKSKSLTDGCGIRTSSHCGSRFGDRLGAQCKGAGSGGHE